MTPNHAGQQFDLLSTSRQAKLNAWLALRGILKRDLATRLGVHPSMITRILQGTRRPARLIAELVALGIPAHLLPEPGPAPGRPVREHKGSASDPSRKTKG
ncbi:MAG: helix-turn-helix transcriptional regulator [Thermodesulfobacteriota bacterium]